MFTGRIRKHLAAVLSVMLISGGLVRAMPPETFAVADMFEPAFEGVTMVDHCSGVPSTPCDSIYSGSPGITGSLKVDALGHIYLWEGPVAVGSCTIGSTVFPLSEWRLRRVSQSTPLTTVGVIREKCESLYARKINSFAGFDIDTINGIGYAFMWTQNFDEEANVSGYAFVSISGLPTLLDIILSYQPPSTLSFNVPVRPEGLPGPDSFAVYAGDVRTAADLSQASPLQCTVPTGRASVPGDQLTVTDTLPDPAAGAGRYYVAAVKHGEWIRAGRSSNNGVLHGRNASGLSGCQ
jgi:hypothetical protein